MDECGFVWWRSLNEDNAHTCTRPPHDSGPHECGCGASLLDLTA